MCMKIDGVMYGYVVRNFRKPKKDFCLSCEKKNILNKHTYALKINATVGTSTRIIDDSLFVARRYVE